MPDELAQLKADVAALEKRICEIEKEREIPDGDFEAEIVAATQSVSYTGKEMWKFEFRITRGAHTGKSCWYNVVIPEPDTNFIDRMAGRLNVVVRRTRSVWVDGHDPTRLVGVHCVIAVRNKYWQGVRYAEVRDVRADH